ncbi:alpha/beta hydrolase family protein [Pseudemcibacter aquimaris]|uniref:alpha/beta hydrolase family protein n=1 Tax=Pseudemcibacter aquimaris TaxID=2857064 RepID=UPI002012A61E|nr:S9 family peptidase [Pseudemcibacter aquimaris]MCC3860407.1 S9 family peptidase [Pseudemcibacter aquimaris]WDU57733.1 S9 family peptidase [Pseudemcibacter aquimaris]
MKKLALILVLLIISPWVVISSTFSQEIPIDNLIETSKYNAVSISPDQEKYFILSLSSGQPKVWIKGNPFKTNDINLEYSLPISLLSNIAWINNDQLIVAYTVLEKNSRGTVKKYFREWALIDTNINNINVFLKYEVNRVVANQPATLLHALPEDDDHILISHPVKKKLYPSLHKVNIITGDSELVLKEREPVLSWVVDKDGTPLLGYGNDDEKQVLLIYDHDAEKFRDYSDQPLFESGNFAPLTNGVTNETMFVSSSVSHGRKKIYHYDYKRKRILSKVFEHPKVDAQDIIYSYQQEKVVAALYVDNTMQYEFFDENLENLHNKLSEMINGKNIFLSSYGENQDYVVVSASNEVSPIDFYIYERKTEGLKLVASNSIAVENYELADVNPITYFSRDGLEIHSYLTRPKTKTDELLPAVILPHGGPWVRDTQDYNEWVQLLANRGYVVLQPNFRGSTGYGNIFVNMSQGEWGGKMQDDLTDGVKWLVRNENVDPEKICIVGGSYGGYAALMGVVKDPDLYKCAISFAPVTDLKSYFDTFKILPEKGMIKNRVVGNPSKGNINEKSPNKQAKKIKVPIFLVHGNSDIRVEIKHSHMMDRALKKAKKDYEFLELESGTHFLLQKHHKKIFFEKMITFLQTHIGE